MTGRTLYERLGGPRNFPAGAVIRGSMQAAVVPLPGTGSPLPPRPRTP
jgi:hypothetical protein